MRVMVVGAGPVDRAVEHPARGQPHRHPDAAAHDVAEHESEPHALTERVAGGGVTDAPQHVLDGQGERLNRRERDDPQGPHGEAPLPVAVRGAGEPEPVRSDPRDTAVEHRSVREFA